MSFWNQIFGFKVGNVVQWSNTFHFISLLDHPNQNSKPLNVVTMADFALQESLNWFYVKSELYKNHEFPHWEVQKEKMILLSNLIFLTIQKCWQWNIFMSSFSFCPSFTSKSKVELCLYFRIDFIQKIF